MKKSVLSFLLLWYAQGVCIAQTVSKSDSVEIVQTADKFFELIRNPNDKKFEKIIAQEIYCLICEGASTTGRKPHVLSRRLFLDKYLRAFRNYENIRRASLKKGIRLIIEKPSNNIMMLVTTWAPNEYATGQEGAQMELHFIKRGDFFYFTGIASIP